MDPVTQLDRLLSIETPLNFDVLVLDSFRGVEAISRPYRFDLTLMADTAFGLHNQVEIDKLMGNDMAIGIQLPLGQRRFIHGRVKNFTVGTRDERFVHYHATLVPWFDFLKLSSNCRFFQNKTVPDIIEEVFADLGFQDFRISLDRSYTAWDYCAQYRESDFNFLSRLMEAEGIFYFFEHTKDKHTLVLADSVSAYKDVPGQSQVRFATLGSFEHEEDVVQSWQTKRELLSSLWKFRDYHFETPRATLEVEEPAKAIDEASQQLKQYDYPGGYAKKFNEPEKRIPKIRPEGETLVKLEMEGEEVDHITIEGDSNCRSFVTGCKFKITSDRLQQVQGTFLLTEIHHHAEQRPGYVSHEDPLPGYSNHFIGIPAEVPFRPEEITRKPMVQGPHTAFVVDENPEPKEEIWPDKYGRIRVRFPWDIKNKFSCWLRVAQPWAGRGWGHQWIPRVGDEVLVDFLEGDPDCPIVVGSLYNSDNMPPFKLPDYKTQSGIATRTTMKGTTHQFNMLRFEDKKGHEQVFIKSQRRGDIRILAGFYETNHADRNTVVGWEDGTETGGNYNELIKGESNIHVKKGRFENVDEKLNLTVKDKVVYDFEADHATMVKNTSSLNAKKILIEGSQEICLKVGGNFITIDQSGVTIYGTMVKINSGGFGDECPDAAIDDALDAATSDNGEPGYLDRQARGGGGPAGHHHRTLRAQHAPSRPRAGEDARMTAIRNTLSNSATGRHALEVYDRYGVNSVFRPGTGGYYSDPSQPADPNTMVLDPGWGDYNNTAFVHEMNHAQSDHEGTSPNIVTDTRTDYVNRNLQEEARGDALANQTRRELNDAGLPQTNQAANQPSYDTGYQNGVNAARAANPNATPEELDQAGRAAGQQHVLNDYQNGSVTPSSVGGVAQPPYPQYYGNAWDAAHPGGH